jgi:hypothetical protein
MWARECVFDMMWSILPISSGALLALVLSFLSSVFVDHDKGAVLGVVQADALAPIVSGELLGQLLETEPLTVFLPIKSD